MASLVRVEAPHFVAGVEVVDGHVTRAAPILCYMLRWPHGRVFSYAARKGWAFEVI
jgi:hypothetical protein